MKKIVLVVFLAVAGIFAGWKLYHARDNHTITAKAVLAERLRDDEEEKDREDGIRETQEQEFEVTKDIRLGYIPRQRLITAYQALMRNRALRANAPNTANMAAALTWSERGPNTDVAGPYGNSRVGSYATSGRMRAILVDLADASNKTVWIGGIDGGIWKTTDITASPASWTLVNDFFSNMAIGAICQDPSNTNIMYFGTGEKAINSDAVRGGGVWKSTDHGVTWNLLPSTTSFWNVSKVLCDNSGNVYVSTMSNGNGIQRSIDGGTTWTNITPSGANSNVTEMKLSSTGRLHIVCGYRAGANAGYFYTDIPSTVAAAGWTSPVTAFSPVQYNCEMAVTGNTLYVLNADASYQTPTVYKSIDGGANWAQANSPALSTSGNNALSSGQGWYNLALAVDPADPNNVIAGGLNCYKSTNGGVTWSQVSVWVGGISGTVTNYVHADQQTAVWNGNQVLMGTDGGIFYSANAGTTFSDRNIGLRLKQFYSCAIHPGSANYFLAGAQDNGSHQFTNAGLSGSTEVTGGDGAFVHIDQDQPQYQFTSYVRSQYHVSADGGSNWTDVNYSGSIGSFINPTDYDDGNNIMYTGAGGGQYIHWDNPQTSGTSFTQVSIGAFSGGGVSNVLVSPYTPNRVFFGTYNGKIVRVDNANQASPTATAITGGSMSASTVSCIAAGTNDDNLLATFSNYGSTHVWVTNNGGVSWTNISGNLPDIPVRWVLFYPEDNTKAIVATEMGVYETSLINAGSTVWAQDAGFPVVRTDMLQYRKGDGTIAAATHGRGLWTSTIPFTNPYIRFDLNYATRPEATTATSGCRGYTDYTVNMTIDQAPVGNATVTVSVAAGGTAVQGADFDFTTNGSFSSPSATLTFANGSTTPQPVTLRVYDDVAIEGVQSFTLNYAVSGTTNALAAPSCPSYTLYITDNDAGPVVPSGSSATYSVGSYAYNLTTGSDANPFNAKLASNRSQLLYKASELTALGMSAGNITSVGFTMIKQSSRAYQNLKINMGMTTTSYLVNGSTTVVATSTYKTLASYSTVNGLNTFILDTPFPWDGTSNIVVEVCYDNGSADAANNYDVLNGYSDGGGASQGNMFWQNGINCSGSFSGIDYFGSGIKPTVKFAVVASGNPVETALNASKTAYLGPNKDVYFYNSNGDLIARVTNLSSFDYGCTQITVDRAGSASTIFWNNNIANYLMDKTLHVVPTNNNATGQYQVTLYYTAAEKNGWEAATGQSFGSIQLVKAAGQISLVTPSTPTAAGTVETVTPTIGAYGTDYTLTYTFNSGFSGFGAGIPATSLPVTLLNFSGRLENNMIPLGWSTSSEQNTAYFEVQKSVDGTGFYPLGKVTAAGNSSTERRYSYIDKAVSAENYYRLRMVDIDGKFTYSNVVVIKSPGVQQQVWVVNNPFRSYIDIRLARLPQQQVRAELVTMSGVVAFSRAYAGALQLRLDLGGAPLSAGTYLLRTTVDGKRFANKVVKQ